MLGQITWAGQILGQITWASQNVGADYLGRPKSRADYLGPFSLKSGADYLVGQITWSSANCWADYLGITAFVTVRRDTLLRHGLVVLLRETALAVRGCGVQHLEPGALTVLPVFNSLLWLPLWRPLGQAVA